MIPWFIVDIIGALASIFGYDIYVRAWSGNWWGAEGIYFMHRVPGAQKLRRLSRWNGGPLMAAPDNPVGGATLTEGIDITDLGIETEVLVWPARTALPSEMGPS